MTTTTSSFLQVTQNLPRMQAMTSAEPAVKSAATYYAANIGSVKSIDDLVGNYRLLSYALASQGLSDQINSTALIKQVLAGGVTDPKSLANTLGDPRWKAFAAAFDFGGKGAASLSTPSAVATTSADYVEQQLETDEGQQNVGVQLALYFQRVAPTITNSYGLLGDKNLLQVVQTIFGLSPASSASDIDAQAATIAKLVPMTDLADPAKVTQLTERFTAMYDLVYGPSSGASTSLSTSNGGGATPDAATTVLSGIVSANAANLASGAASGSFSESLLTSLQGFHLGG